MPHPSSVALVTGANRGIGRTLAMGLLADGFRVAAFARSSSTLQGLAEEANVDPTNVLPIELDLSDEAAIAPAVQTVSVTFGRIDLLVNNAGMGLIGSLGVSASSFDELLKVNLSAPFRILQAVVPVMLQQNSGTIVNVASRAGKVGFANVGAYGASKFGLVGLGESLYRELSPKGIRVTTLCPSWVDTRMAQESGTPLPAHEMIQPDDLMKTVRWLLSLSPAACVREVMIECRANIE